MKKKVLLGLVLLAIIGASVVVAQNRFYYNEDVYKCRQCEKEVAVKVGAKAPSNTGLCPKNPSRLSTAHDYYMYYDGKTNQFTPWLK